MTTSGLSDKASELIEIISQEASVFEDFLTLLERQQEMLVKNDIDGLNNTTARQREKVVESQLLNRKR
ncbi:MAG: flagellar export chaperone FlgN, partial [Candidatus Zixiibacteriota bacterium]